MIMHRIKIFHCQYIQSGFMISLLWQLKVISIMHVLYTNMTTFYDMYIKRMFVKALFTCIKRLGSSTTPIVQLAHFPVSFMTTVLLWTNHVFYNVDIAEKKNLLQISFLILRVTYIIYILSQITSYTGEMFICNTTCMYVSNYIQMDMSVEIL